MALILAIGIIAAAVVGGLIEYLLGHTLPDGKPKLRHIIATFVAILVFTGIATWSALREDTIKQEAHSLTIEELKSAGAFVEIESIDPSPDDTILTTDVDVTVVVDVTYYLPSSVRSPQIELHYLTAYQSEDRHSSWHIIHTLPAEVGTHYAKLAGTVRPPDPSNLDGEPFQIGVILDMLNSEKGQMSKIVEDSVTFSLSPNPTTGSTARPASSTGEPRIVLPVCDCEETITTDEPIVIRLRWGAKTQALTENGAGFVVYNVLVNGNPIQGLNKYRKPAEFVPGSGDNEDIWWVYWDYPLGTLAEGEYVIESEFFTSAPISDGWTTIPANSPRPHKVILHIVPPSNP